MRLYYLEKGDYVQYFKNLKNLEKEIGDKYIMSQDFDFKHNQKRIYRSKDHEFFKKEHLYVGWIDTED